MTSSPVRCAIIGYGRIGRLCHAITREASLPLSIVAVADPLPPTQAGPARVVSDYRQLFSAPDVEAVIIATPPASHVEVARDALLAGRDVLLEKPPARTVGEAEELRELAGRSGRVLVYAFHAQHNPAVERAAAELKAATILQADIVFKENASRFHPPGSFAFAEGALRDSGVNAISILTRLLPSTTTLSVTHAELRVAGESAADTRAIVRFRFGNVGSGLVDVDTGYVGPEARQVTLRTSMGTAHLDIVRGTFAFDDHVVAPQVSADTMRYEYRQLLLAFAVAVRGRLSSANPREVAWLDSAITVAHAGSA